MVQYPTILNLPQADINRQLYEMILKAEDGDAATAAAIAARVKALEDAIGTETKSGTILYRIKQLETAEQSSSG